MRLPCYKKYIIVFSVVVDDGSCVAMVNLTGPDVKSLLQLTDEQWMALRQEVSRIGEVFVQGVSSSIPFARICEHV